ncbi:hypothetical protein OJAV_G00183850 [Oryzias javanicus]|uniref:Uncharacterized protein n=1 Tax=Oryzias javanicus TaxID=123683 RepID=A0A3S2LTC7_ORYJA|nr:hypothetical protein OJAV_G00183850 [Oryzias javanicus]
MLLSVLLLLLVGCTHASHFYGTMMTYNPKEIQGSDLIVVVRYKLSFRSCTDGDTWSCSGNCGSLVGTPQIVLEASNELWCQREAVWTWRLSSNAPSSLTLSGGNWISGIKNSVILWKAVTQVELRNRSDTGRPNASPQTTIMPSLRVPSNCRRDYDLLAFDPDGDEVQCRYGMLSECNPCNDPTVLSLSDNCTLSFSPTSSANEGPYAVQMMMEDFPRQTITLTQTDGSFVVKNPFQDLSKIPVQFVLKVDPAVASCTEGVFLPKFLPPTPANKDRLYADVDQTLKILVRAEAANSTITTLLFSGPHGVAQVGDGSGNFNLTWTPSDSHNNESHPICFVVQAVSSSSSSTLYHSDLRCIIVTVGGTPPPANITITPTQTVTETKQTTPEPSTPEPLTPEPSTPSPTDESTLSTQLIPVGNNFVVAMSIGISTNLPWEDIKDEFLTQLKAEFVRRGLPPDLSLQILKSQRV